MKSKIKNLMTQLNHGLVEREEPLRIALLTMLAGEHIVLIGPPGTGKSMIARRISECLAQSDKSSNDYFEYLLTKFSTPEEIFGPLSITALKENRYERNTAGYLPTVKVAFLDEIFKASSSILNALLTILNERIYHNGTERQDSPLRALIAASNELPTDQEELSALYDRFLVRSYVDYVSESNLSLLFEKEDVSPSLNKLTAEDLNSIQSISEAVTIPADIAKAVQRIWGLHKETFKEDRRERLSDRRLKKVIKLLSVSAATNGRREVDLSDVILLKNCLWNHQENAVKVRDLILSTLRNFSRLVPQNAATVNESTEPAKARRKSGSVVKGFNGSGSERDPLLIESVDDLFGLERIEVGLQGYYFLQTADIDCTELTSWMNIPFKGNYDGGGHAIKYKNVGEVQAGGIFVSSSKFVELFSSIQAKSRITNLKLEDLQLAASAEDSFIAHCMSNVHLIKKSATNCTITACQVGANLINDKATNCTITACESTAYLIGGDATNCTIEGCESNAVLIRGNATNSTITDCLVMINRDLKEIIIGNCPGGIAQNLTQGSVVERCFVTGEVNVDNKFPDFYFYGITSSCEKSIIRQCALGRFKLDGRGARLAGRIAGKSTSATLENNVSYDSNSGESNVNGKDGKSLPVAAFNQHYFEHTLGWDFSKVWQWDELGDKPSLRSVGLGVPLQLAAHANMTDLLQQQIYSNIWL